MFPVKGQNLTIVILMVIVLILLATLSVLKLGSNTALAQGGISDGANKIRNEEANNRGPNNAVMAEASDINPQSDGSGVEVVSIAAFKNDGDSGNGWFHSFDGGYIQNESGNLVCFMAPTYPPDGATLTQFRFTLLDDNAPNDLSVFLNRVALATGVVNNIAGGALVGRDSSIATEAASAINPGTAVVSKAYAYYVNLCFDANTGSEIRLFGARLFYTP